MVFRFLSLSTFQKFLCLIRKNAHISKANVKIKFKFMTQTDSERTRGQQNFTDLSSGIIISNSWTANKKSASYGYSNFALSLARSPLCPCACLRVKLCELSVRGLLRRHSISLRRE